MNVNWYVHLKEISSDFPFQFAKLFSLSGRVV